jgi:hypothetical protein
MIHDPYGRNANNAHKLASSSDSLQYLKQLSFSRALLAVQEAPGLRIGPVKSQPQHGKGALTRAYGRNVVAASEVSDSDRRMLPR